MADINCKLLVIGAGPGGYVCAIRAAQLGVDTVIVESESFGGTCLNVGCIPSKALIHAAEEFYKAVSCSTENNLGIEVSAPKINLAKTIEWKDGIVGKLNSGVQGLLKKAGVKVLHGNADFLDGKTVRVTGSDGDQTISAEQVVIATGSKPVELPSLPFGGKVISSTEALMQQQVPGTLAVVGGGYIGLEIGMAYAKLGASVIVVEAAGSVLPQYDADLTKPVVSSLGQLGIEVMTTTRANAISEEGLVVESADGTVKTIAADKVLVTIGRVPRTDGCSLEELSLTMDGAFIQIDNKCQTSMRGVYAIGDVTGEPMLAHRAMAQGQMVAEIAAGQNRVWDKVCIPAVCFTDPEIVTAGVSPSEALEAGHEITVGQFPFQANGRAMTMESNAGFVRVVANKTNGVLLGVQAVGQGVSELSSAFAIALEMGACAEDIEATIHAHPTLSEGFAEACMQVTGSALHI